MMKKPPVFEKKPSAKLLEEERKVFIQQNYCQHGGRAPSRYEFGQLLWEIRQMKSEIAVLKVKVFEQQIEIENLKK